MIRRTIQSISLLALGITVLGVTVFGITVSSAHGQVRDPISRKTSPEKGFFENSSRGTVSRSNSSGASKYRQATTPSRYRWFWRAR